MYFVHISTQYSYFFYVLSDRRAALFLNVCLIRICLHKYGKVRKVSFNKVTLRLSRLLLLAYLLTRAGCSLRNMRATCCFRRCAPLSNVSLYFKKIYIVHLGERRFIHTRVSPLFFDPEIFLLGGDYPNSGTSQLRDCQLTV